MSRESQLLKNTIVLSMGRFLPKIVSFITLPIITGCLSKSEMGNYDLISTLISLIIPVATLQIHSGAFRFLIQNRNNPDQSKRIISSLAAFCLPVMVIVSIIVGLIYPGFDLKLRVMLSFYFFLDGLGVNIGQIVRGLGYNKYYSMNSILTSIISCICIIISVKNAKLGLYGMIISYVISHTIALLYIYYRVKIRNYVSGMFVSKSMIKELISYSWPMIPNNLSNWVLNLSDRLVITTFLGIEANAVYAVANKIPGIIRIGQSILIMAWQESASLAVNDNDADAYYSRMFNLMLTVLIGFTALLIGFSPILFRLFIRGDYGESYPQIPILFLGIFFSCMSSFLGGIYIAHMKTKSVGITTLGAAVINLAVDFLLIQRLGIFAGSISTLVAYLALYVFRCIRVKEFQHIEFRVKQQIIYYLVICSMLVICYMNDLRLNILNAVLGVIVFLILNRKLIAKISHKLRKLIVSKK